jgi:lipopolysaccharide transport system ATP-binding protein
MSDPIIVVEKLGKQFQLGQLQQRHDTLRDALVDSLSAPIRRLRRRDHSREQDHQRLLWALKDVSFEVQAGKAIGIIGRNGAGKSTLLKILSRITEPTEGRAVIHGRVGSLLEVGTGFHPELSGRENIYLNGAILGMQRSEIKRKFDEIVEFAEVARFLDTPVKRYSSGMYVRLAFAVAAHLEPEVLVVDEVLAVGDVAFQKKCLGKMSDVAQEGRTVLFVSHNMSAVQRLCSHALLLERGQVVASGISQDVIARYWSTSLNARLPGEWIDLADASRRGTHQCHFNAVSYTSGDDEYGSQPYSGGPLEFELEIESDDQRAVGSIAVTLYDDQGTKLVNADTVTLGQSISLRPGRNALRLRIVQLHLNPGIYVLGLWLANPMGIVFDHIESAARIEVIASESKQFGAQPIADGVVTNEFTVEKVQ